LTWTNHCVPNPGHLMVMTSTTSSIGRPTLLLPWLLLLFPRGSVWGLAPCTDPGLEYRGYTYAVDAGTGERVWSHCDFPSPTADHERCGMAVTDGVHFVCDPDLLIDTQGTYPDR
jgi:hypothetical protein